MNYFRGLFKDKKKETSRNPSPNDDHHNHRRHHDAAVPDCKQDKEHRHHFEEIPAEQLPQKDRGDSSTSAPENVAPPPPPAAESSSSEEEAPSYQASPPQRPQAQQSRLQPAYRYTGGEFSETISREEARLARQYNFAGSTDRARAEATASTTRRAVGESKNGEFDSIFNQFMHGGVDQ